jgi:PD-(D/E)XK nuclease superfamily protein
MPDTLRISAKNLGALALPGACERCFWFRLKTRFDSPWSIFPGIFSSIDRYTKRVVEEWHARNGAVPAWLSECGNVVACEPIPSPKAFRTIDAVNGIELTGTPDAIFRFRDGSFAIADYKTAKFSGTQDELFPIYEAQLNGYARIAEDTGLVKPVVALFLVYFEPDTDGVLDGVYRDDGFSMNFRCRVLPVTKDGSKLDPLLAAARRIADMEQPADHCDSCGDCRRLERLLACARSPVDD